MNDDELVEEVEDRLRGFHYGDRVELRVDLPLNGEPGPLGAFILRAGLKGTVQGASMGWVSVLLDSDPVLLGQPVRNFQFKSLRLVRDKKSEGETT